MGRKYRTETNLRSNLYVVGIADSGSGKNHAREIVNELFFEAGLAAHLGGNKIASGAGLLTALHRQPALLLQIDEFGMFMSAAADGNAARGRAGETLIRRSAWLGRCRRLAKDWEKSLESSTAWTLIASIRLMTRRLARYCYVA